LNLPKIFKTGEIGAGRLSKLMGVVLPTFQTRIVPGEPVSQILNWRDCPLPDLKRFSAGQEIFYPIGAKDLTTPVLERFVQIQKLLALPAKNLLIQYRIKGKV
jgi:hypothetical protein